MSQRLYVVVFTDSKGEVDQVHKAIESYADDAAVELQESDHGSGKCRGKFLVTGPVVDEIGDDTDAFARYIWGEIGDYCWISLNGTDRNGDISEKYAKAEYEELMDG